MYCHKLKIMSRIIRTLQWRHNERDGVSYHQPHDCLLHRLLKPQIKENTKAPRHWYLVRGIPRSPVNSPHKGPATRKMFPFDDVIMTCLPTNGTNVIPHSQVTHIYGRVWSSLTYHLFCVNPLLQLMLNSHQSFLVGKNNKNSSKLKDVFVWDNVPWAPVASVAAILVEWEVRQTIQ